MEFEAPLITYARGMLSFTTGDIKGAREQFRKLKRRGRKVNIVGVNLSIPDEVGLVEVDEKPEPKKKVMVEAKIDFAIITAIEIERLAVCKAFQITAQDRVHKGIRVYWRKRLQLEDNEFYEILVTQLPDAAGVDAALAVSDTIFEWKPEAVLMVGIAGAAKEGVQLGDLVLAREVCYYGRGKETVDGTLPEPKYYSADTTLWDRVISLLPWDSSISSERPDGKDVKPNTHCGVIASSEKVIANADIRDEIAANHRKIEAIEMEGYGVSAATFKQYRPVRCLVIRGISDLADASKNDQWQPYAAAVAAEFTKYFLLDKPLKPQNLPPPTPALLRLRMHYKLVTRAIIHGQLIPFLGRGINSCDRPPGNSKWQPGSSYPPSDSELADYLAKNYGTPFFESEIREPNYEQLLEQGPAGKLGRDEFFISPLFPNQRLVAERNELPYLAQYVEMIFGSLGLYTELHEIFAKDYRPNQLHEFFAQLPHTMQKKGYSLPYELIVTTNYDDTLERAFQAIQQPFDLVSYIAKKGDDQGKFLHQPYIGKPIVIDSPNTYDEFPLGKHPVILKLSGAVDRTAAQKDNFVITEDHYMDYLYYSNIPISLVDLMRNNHILFLGHDLSHWTQRLIFRRIWQDKPFDKSISWVVREKLGEFEKTIWQKSRVEIVEIPSESSLGAYITELNEQLQAIPKKEQTTRG